MDVQQVTLAGHVARVEPLGFQHADDLLRAGADPTIWTYMPTDPSGSADAMRTWIADALALRETGSQLPFAIIEVLSGQAVGSTRFLNISPHDRGLEIGWTWLAPRVQRTAVNTECKYLLLQHAFEDVGAIRVQLKTDSRNLVSQRAIERLGAAREGLLRKHMIVQRGHQRDTVMYSIIDTEWPQVKTRLEDKLRQDAPGD